MRCSGASWQESGAIGLAGVRRCRHHEQDKRHLVFGQAAGLPPTFEQPFLERSQSNTEGLLCFHGSPACGQYWYSGARVLWWHFEIKQKTIVFAGCCYTAPNDSFQKQGAPQQTTIYYDPIGKDSLKRDPSFLETSIDTALPHSLGALLFEVHFRGPHCWKPPNGLNPRPPRCPK